MRRNLSALIAGLFIISAMLSACTANTANTVNEPAVESAPAATNAPAEEAATEVSAEPEMSGLLPEVNPIELAGDIIAAGSSTVYPLEEAMANRFVDEGYAGNLTIDSIGSGGGFERFCVNGETDIANASRGIKDSEVEACRSIGLEPIEFRVGTDALAVVVSKENTFISNATMEELAMIFSDQAEKWSDINSEWPEESILRFIPGTDSGTFDFFVEEVFDKEKEGHLNASNTQLSEDDNVLVQGVLGSPYAIGYFGYAYYQENADEMNILSIEGVTPDAVSVEDGSYPLARPLFIYSDAKIMQDKPQVAGFINFFLSYVNEEIGTVGYFPASEASLEEAQMKWLDAVK
jgi:phosphate transport system substrate-binding protein